MKHNTGGMRLAHSFALWLQVKTLQPEFVIENGVNLGHSTWIVRLAAPNATIFSLDPLCDQVYCDATARYYTGGGNPRTCRCAPSAPFRDFAKVDWRGLRVDPARAVVLFDDHQDALLRLRQALHLGFRRIIFDDNHISLQGDLYSPKQMCDESGGASILRYRGDVDLGQYRLYRLGNFGKSRAKISLQEHRSNRQWLLGAMKLYYEFPPVLYHYTLLLGKPFRGHLGELSDAMLQVVGAALVPPPLVRDRLQLPLRSLDLQELVSYNWMCYIELW